MPNHAKRETKERTGRAKLRYTSNFFQLDQDKEVDVAVFSGPRTGSEKAQADTEPSAKEGQHRCGRRNFLFAYHSILSSLLFSTRMKKSRNINEKEKKLHVLAITQSAISAIFFLYRVSFTTLLPFNAFQTLILLPTNFSKFFHVSCAAVSIRFLPLGFLL